MSREISNLLFAVAATLTLAAVVVVYGVVLWFLERGKRHEVPTLRDDEADDYDD